MRHLAERLREIPGVVAVTLVGSRAEGTARDDSDWDFGLYYRGAIDLGEARAFGFEGELVGPREWGGPVDEGVRLVVEGQRVDLLYRDLDVVQHWLAVGEVLVGELPRPGFPERLRETAPPRWRASAKLSLGTAGTLAGRGDVGACVGLLAKAGIAAAQATLAERGEWALSEKGIIRRAGLSRRVESILAAPGDRAFELERSVELMRVALALPSA